MGTMEGGVVALLDGRRPITGWGTMQGTVGWVEADRGVGDHGE